MSAARETQYLTVCRPEGPVVVHPVPEGDEARAAMHDLLDSYLDRGCAMLLMEIGCGGEKVAVGIVPLTPGEPEHRRRAEAMARGIEGASDPSEGRREG